MLCSGVGTLVNDFCWFCSKTMLSPGVINNSAAILVALICGPWTFLYESLHKASPGAGMFLVRSVFLEIGGEPVLTESTYIKLLKCSSFSWFTC